MWPRTYHQPHTPASHVTIVPRAGIYSPCMPADPAVEPRRRSDPLDGIRGIAIVLVVLSHGWTLFPLAGLRTAAPLDALFHAGNLAVTTFFVVGGFLVTRTLLARHSSAAGLRPARYWVQRMVRLGVQVYPLLVVILVVHWLDAKDEFGAAATWRSVAAVGTYTWNWYLENHALDARSDLGHLWYLSVQEQYYLLLILVIALFARFRTRLLWAVAAAIVLVTLWRAHAWHHEGTWRPSLRLTTRCDGLLWGTLAALLADRVAALRRYAANAFTGSALVMLVIVGGAARFGDAAYFTWQAPVFDAAAAVWVLAVSHLDAATVTDTSQRILHALSWRPLVMLGVASLAIYVWHYPLFWFIARHTEGWNWFPRTALAAGMLVVLVTALQRYVDAPTRRWLARFSGRPPHRDAGRESASLAANAIDPLENPADVRV